MNARTSTLFTSLQALLSLPVLLASALACAQPAPLEPAARDELPPPAAASAPARPAQAQAAPLQSPVPEEKTDLVTADESAALAAAVAGTCTVIDALMMELCAQSPADDACRR
jgi:hypothetical protein